MNNIFSIIKNKKVFLTFLILTICLEFLFLYRNVNAQEFPDWYNTDANTEAVALDARDDAEKCIDNLSWYKAIIAGFSDILLYAPKQIAYYGTKIASWVISMVLNWPITKATGESGSGAALAFIAGWQSVKDIANMLIVLGFVIIGIAFTLRLEGYGSKKALINLIIIALLINFSGLFCGLFIDASNIAMTTLTKGGVPGNMGIAFYKNIESKENTSKCSALEDNDLGKYIMDNVLFGVIYALVAFCFIYLAVILIARYAYLGILFMLSPLAFACWAVPIPKLKDIWNKWWNEFLKWVFIGVSICFFLNIAGNVINAFPDLNEQTTTLNTLVFYLLIDIIIIVVGIKISTKSSGVGALVSSAIMGTAMAAVTGGTSLATGAAGVAGLRGLAQRGGQKIKDTATSAGEKLRLVTPGTTAAAKSNRLTESTKRLGNITDNAELAKIAERTPITAQQSQDRAAAAQILAERGAFGTIDPKKRDSVMAHAVSMGVSKDKFIKGSAEAFTESTDKEAIRSWKDKEVKSLMDTGMSGVDAYNIVKSQSPTADQLKQAKIDLRRQKTIENALGVSPISDKEVTNKLVEDQIKTEMDAGKTYQEAQKSVAAYKPNETEISVKRGAMAKEKIEKTVAKLSPKKITELPNEAFSVDVSINLTAKQLTEISKNAPPAVVEKIKSTIPDMRKEIESILGLAHGSTDASIRAAVASASRDSAEKVRGIARKMKLINRL